MPETSVPRRVIWVCPKCVTYKGSLVSCKCGYCGTDMIETDTDALSYELADAAKQSVYCADIRERYVENNPLYDMRFTSERIAKQFSHVQSKDASVCPKCGSNQIQIVEKKWSFLTGFLTNKVDRVCVRCKHRF